MLCLCTHDIAQEEDGGGWVRVVVAGFGMGWIRSSDVVDGTSHPPSPPCITELDQLCCGFSKSTPLKFVEVLGANIETLPLRGGHDGIDSSGVLRILRACPRLKYLNVDDNGSLWTDGVDAMHAGLPALETLHFDLFTQPRQEDSVAFAISTLHGVQRACTSSHLRHLRHLWLDMGEVAFTQCRDAVVGLLQAARQLESFCWTGDREWSAGSTQGALHSNRYIHERIAMRERLGADGNALLLPQNRARGDCMVGLLSVVYSQREQ